MELAFSNLYCASDYCCRSLNTQSRFLCKSLSHPTNWYNCYSLLKQILWAKSQELKDMSSDCERPGSRVELGVSAFLDIFFSFYQFLRVWQPQRFPRRRMSLPLLTGLPPHPCMLSSGQSLYNFPLSWQSLPPLFVWF